MPLHTKFKATRPLGWEGVFRINLAQERDKWRDVMDMEMELRIQWNSENGLTSCSIQLVTYLVCLFVRHFLLLLKNVRIPHSFKICASRFIASDRDLGSPRWYADWLLVNYRRFGTPVGHIFIRKHLERLNTCSLKMEVTRCSEIR